MRLAVAALVLSSTLWVRACAVRLSPAPQPPAPPGCVDPWHPYLGSDCDRTPV